MFIIVLLYPYTVTVIDDEYNFAITYFRDEEPM